MFFSVSQYLARFPSFKIVCVEINDEELLKLILKEKQFPKEFLTPLFFYLVYFYRNFHTKIYKNVSDIRGKMCGKLRGIFSGGIQEMF